MTLINIDDYQLNVNDYIADRKLPTLLLIHDLGQDSSAWEELIGSFGQDYNVITYDVFGHGKTTDSQIRVTINQLIYEVSEVIHHSGAEKLHLAGSGFGGLIAILAAKALKPFITSVTLLSTPCFMLRGAYSLRYRYFTGLLKCNRPLLSQTIADGSVHRSNEKKINYLQRAFARLRGQTFADFVTLLNRLNQKRDFLLMDEINQMSLPVLNLIPEYAGTLSSWTQMLFSSFGPGNKTFVVPQTANNMVLDRPREVARLIKKFLTKSKHRPVNPVYQLKGGESERIETLIKRSFAGDSYENQIISIDTVHTFSAFLNDVPVKGIWSRRQAIELLLFLALHNGTVSKEQLIDSLLPELPVEQARMHLRARTAYLNKLFQGYNCLDSGKILDCSRNSVTVQAHISCDFVDQIHALKKLEDNEGSCTERAGWLMVIADYYHTSMLKDTGSIWLGKCMTQMQQGLIDAMKKLIPELIKHGDRVLAAQVLKTGRSLTTNDKPYSRSAKQKGLKQAFSME